MLATLSDAPKISGSMAPQTAPSPGGTLYAQVASVMRQRIRSNHWAPGEKLPTLDEFEQEFQVARVTLRQALGLLEDEGLIWRRRGRGTFVAEKPPVEWLHVGSSWHELVHGLEGNWARPISQQDVDAVPGLIPSNGSRQPPQKSFRHIRRVHGHGDVAHALVDLYLLRSLYDCAPTRFDNEMLIPVLEQLPGVTIAEAKQTLAIGTADRHVAAALDIVMGAPVGILRRVLKETDGTIIYVGEVIYRGDRVKIEIDLHPELAKSTPRPTTQKPETNKP